MLTVLITKVHLTVTAMLGILVMDLIVLVSKSLVLSLCLKFCTFLVITNCLFLLLYLDIDECLSSPCHINANCTDNEGSFACKCNTGFLGDGWSCSSMCKTF